MRLTRLIEHDIVPWEALPGQMVVDDAGEWRLSTAPERLAASYTMQVHAVLDGPVLAALLATAAVSTLALAPSQRDDVKRR
ncbi:MAG: hypothetical protein JO287_15000 [Pseudonocardiales bacterium]|nr:hypothetical protein [Pseudonocardiales bacterium]